MTDIGFTGGGKDAGMVYVAGSALSKLSNTEMIDRIVEMGGSQGGGNRQGRAVTRRHELEASQECYSGVRGEDCDMLQSTPVSLQTGLLRAISHLAMNDRPSTKRQTDSPSSTL